MPVSQVLNPKGVIKRPSNNDLPFAPQQPVIASTYATSTAGQTVINLSFSVDTTNSDIFWLFVDGKKLDLGSSNDYTFTSVGADLTSSQVTLNQALPANMNIQAFKLGLKKESEFLTDNRFVQAYEYLNDGFQGFINQGEFTITPTTTTGTPAAGTFYSSIIGRASMTDISQDLRARMGVERIIMQNCFMLQGEVGPSGQAVYGVINDTFSQIRLVGNWINITSTQEGQFIDEAGLSSNGYMEVTFYGTGLNILTYAADSGARSIKVGVDGGAVGSNIYIAGTGVAAKNWATNQVIQAVNGLSLGIHTVTIQNGNGSQADMIIYGVEILNESSNITVNSGVGYIQGKKYVSSSQKTFAYGSPATGTTGGRVVIYQNGDGSISTAFTQNATSPSYLSSASHTNEEAVRTHHYREFGAGRADDFSGTAAGAARAFALDDDTTNLVATDALFGTTNGFDCLQYAAFGQSIALVFVGTGLDVRCVSSVSATALVTILVDGVTVASSVAGNTIFPSVGAWSKIASGLPYGTHVVTISLASGSGTGPQFDKFMVYQPKLPSIPSGSVILADYNVMANFAANSTSGNNNLSTGVLRKYAGREMIYTGTSWTMVANIPEYTGAQMQATAASNTVQYTFFGTGFDMRCSTPGAAAVTWQFTLIDTAHPSGTTNLTGAGATTSFYGANITSFTGSTGTVVFSTTSASNNGVVVSGLPLGWHTIKFAYVSGTAGFNLNSFDIITPIHSVKSNLTADLQNTLPVGSNSISDDRATTPVKNTLPSSKAWAQAIGITNGPTTTSGSLVPMPDMSLTIKTSGGALDISYSFVFSTNVANSPEVIYALYVDGVQVDLNQNLGSTTANVLLLAAERFFVPVSAGVHKVDLFWRSPVAGTTTVTLNGTVRTLSVREM